MDLAGARGKTDVHLIGVSVPRSGHNLVVRLLQALLADNLFYCERYLTSGCCQALPCARRGTRQMSFQKSHDLEHDLPRDVADACYLVQHRAPVPAILSARELYADEYGEAFAADRDEYAVWLGRNAEYLVTFHDRWIAEPPANGIVVEYDDLIAHPGDVLQRIVSVAGIDVPEATVQAAVASTMPRGGIGGERPFVPRSIDGSRYVDRELLTIFESIVVDALPRYAPGRAFEPVEYQGTLIWYVYAALRAQRAGDLDTGIRLLDEALERWPENGMLLFEQSWLLLKQGRYAEAQRLLERSATLLPTHPPVLDLLVTAALAAGDAPGALGPMRALATDVAPTIANRLRLAKVLAHNHDRPGAAEILDDVVREAPDDAQVWRDVSEVRLVRGELSEARLALETAIRLSPLQADLYRRHGDVLLKLEKPSRAAHALRQSLALDPRQAATWRLLIEALLADDDRAGILQAVDEAHTHVQDDAELEAALANARHQVLVAAHRGKSSGEPGPATAQRPVRRVAVLVDWLPGTRLAGRLGRRIGRELRARLSPAGQEQIQLMQLRAALGAAEARLADTEQRLRGELEQAWSQASRLERARRQLHAALTAAVGDRDAAVTRGQALDGTIETPASDAEDAQAEIRRLSAALARQRASAEAAWAQARVLDAALTEQQRNAEEGWAQARSLDAQLAERQQDARAGWTQAQNLDAALADTARRLAAALAELERRSAVVREQERKLRESWSHGHRLDAALNEKERELGALRLRVWHLEDALKADSAAEGQSVAGPTGRMHLD